MRSRLRGGSKRLWEKRLRRKHQQPRPSYLFFTKAMGGVYREGRWDGGGEGGGGGVEAGVLVGGVPEPASL